MGGESIPTTSQAPAQAEMTQEEYLVGWGVSCPKCRSTDLEVVSFESDCSYAWQPVSCLTCGAEWRDLFSLEGYELK